ncbi:ATP-binding protein [Anaeroarcus burkinensis]|uniref:ATP-binding protein n=1 Tax=Anaeroarcus burkinensis TaxID=82376 RepID=UPI0003FD8D00|nr:ATP-binding protein [Anaeroarcus burkinensis]
MCVFRRKEESHHPVLRKISLGIILFGMVILCFLWGGVILKNQEEQANAMEEARKETGNIARAFEEHMIRTIKSADQAALFLKYQYEKDGKVIDIPKYIREGSLLPQTFVLISVADENGELQISSQVPFVASNIKDREHFSVHKERDTGKLFISKPVKGRSSGKWSIQMTRRINKPNGSFGGVVIVSVDPFYFTQLYQQVDLGENASITLIGLDGIVRARRSGENEEVGQDLSDAPIMKSIANAPRGSYSAQSPIDEITRIYSYRVIEEYPLAVSVGRSKVVVLQPVQERVLAYGAVAALVTVAIVAFTLMLLNFIKRQEMVEKALQESNLELEEKVDLRTKELISLNQELLATNEQLQSNNDKLDGAYSELKNMQAQILQQEKMASIGQLAAGVAHEINNPMAFVTSNLELLEEYSKRLSAYLHWLEDSIRKLSEGQERLAYKTLQEEMKKERTDQKIEYVLNELEEIIADSLEGAERVKVIVKALKSFSRKDGEAEVSLQDINTGIENTLTIVQNEIKHKAVLHKSLSPLPLTKCNLGQLNQAFLNLLINAAQAIEKNGEITVTTTADKDNIYISIEDTGKGISPEVIQHIFEPFFTTKEVGKGTGLGLSIVYDIIKKHEGEIQVESKEGVGTSFAITLPIRE